MRSWQKVAHLRHMHTNSNKTIFLSLPRHHPAFFETGWTCVCMCVYSFDDELLTVSYTVVNNLIQLAIEL